MIEFPTDHARHWFHAGCKYIVLQPVAQRRLCCAAAPAGSSLQRRCCWAAIKTARPQYQQLKGPRLGFVAGNCLVVCLGPLLHGCAEVGADPLANCTKHTRTAQLFVSLACMSSPLAWGRGNKQSTRGSRLHRDCWTLAVMPNA